MKKLLLACVGLIVLAAGILFVVVSSFDPNVYKPKIIAAIQEKTGRSVALDGAITLNFSFDGVSFGIEKVSFGNPAWASRPAMATVGKFELGVAVLPLLQKNVQITRLTLNKADIQLETNADGVANWMIQPVEGKDSDKPTAPNSAVKSDNNAGAHAPDPAPISVDVRNVLVEDSHISVREKDGKVSKFSVEKMTFGHHGDGFLFNLISKVNGTPVTMAIKTGTRNILTQKPIPLDAVISYAHYRFNFDGTFDLRSRELVMSHYKISSGQTDITGSLTAKLGGAKPAISGNVMSMRVNPADFAPAPTAHEAVASSPVASPQKSSDGRMFSAAPLPLDGLRSADAHLKIKFNEVVLGKTTVKNLSGTIDLFAGRLKVDFPAINLASSTVDFKTVLDASSSPARLELSLDAPAVEVMELMPLLGSDALISAKADAHIALSSTGSSLHDLASHADGSVSLISGGGKVLTERLNQTLLQLVSFGSASGGTIGLNCLAARLKINNGLVVDNGILADTTVTTVLTKGSVNLDAETTDLTVHARPKISKVGAFVPPVHIGGSLRQPDFSVVAANVIKNVAGLLTGNGVNDNSPVPDVVAPAGQNACVYTLDHPAVSPATKTGGLAPVIDQIKSGAKIKDIGNGLLKGLFGQ